jgi:hypothetical protein
MEIIYVTTTNGRKSVAMDFKPNIPKQVAPVIAKEYYNHGMRMYLTTDGRKFNADLYDSNFKIERGALLAAPKKGTARRGRR